MIPTRNNILFKPLQPKEILDSGLYVPESCREIRDKGTIESVGAWVKGFQKGDVVHRVHKWGQEVIIDGEKYFLMDASAILAKE